MFRPSFAASAWVGWTELARLWSWRTTAHPFSLGSTCTGDLCAIFEYFLSVWLEVGSGVILKEKSRACTIKTLAIPWPLVCATHPSGHAPASRQERQRPLRYACWCLRN